jgi:enamine deaminase RidA (YjgF/YER057c/UK114 family)
VDRAPHTEPEGTTWETAVGYSRAVRAGDAFHVSGSMSTDDAGHVGGDPYERTTSAGEHRRVAVGAGCLVRRRGSDPTVRH